MHRVRRVRITSDEGLPVHADGEILFEDAHELVFEIHPGRLMLLL
jgi:diacylglycerol kinase family enzyme